MHDNTEATTFEEEMASMSDLKFSTKKAKIVAIFGRVVGLILMGVGFLVGILDNELHLFNDKLSIPFMLMAWVGLILYYLLHKIAVRIDKKSK